MEDKTREELDKILRLLFPRNIKLSVLDGDSRDVEQRLWEYIENNLIEKSKVKVLREQLHFIWRWIDRLKGSKPHDNPDERWKEYVDVLISHPSSPYTTGDWFEDSLTNKQ